MKIIEIVPKDNAILQIRTEDGQTGLFDVAPYLESEAFTPLKDMREFVRVRNGKYFVEWDCGADLSSDTILARWKAIPSKKAPSLLSAPDQPIKPLGAVSKFNKSGHSGEKSYDVEIIRREYIQAYASWTEEDDAYLRDRFGDGATIADLASEFGRQPGGIRSRIRKLGLKL